jgi:hypothetical protein
MKTMISNSQGMSKYSEAITTEILKSRPRASRVLIVTANDSSALDALKAVCDLKRERYMAIVSQYCMTEAIKEMQKPDSSSSDRL